MKRLFVVALTLISIATMAQGPLPVGTVLPTRQVPVHDPAMIKQGDTYYVFCTGPGVSVWSSKDLQMWRKEVPVFTRPPQWALDTIPGFKGNIWAPDISYHKGRYYLYYAVSTFGKNTSAIGVATNKTLDPSSAEFKWEDKGRVIQSYPGRTSWNAIDPNLILDENGTAYLVFGSFWEGLKMVRLTNDLLHVDEPLDKILTVASRKKDLSVRNAPAVENNPADAGSNAIEAPFIFKRGNYYYLFASIDYCCKGKKSTYKVIVGRSENIQGPYVDKEEAELRRGGGTLLLQGDKDWYGVGHNGICTDDGRDLIIYHGYDATDGGKSKLLLGEVSWDERQWPFVVNMRESMKAIRN